MSPSATSSDNRVSRIAGRIDRAAEFAAGSLDEARVASTSLSVATREHMTALSALGAIVRGAAAERGATTISGAVSELVAATNTLIARVHKRCASQDEAACRATRSTEVIASFARDVSTVAAEARVLALNANIAASRLGHTGAAAAVISKRVHAFASEMLAEVGGLVELSHELADLLPRIERCAASVRSGGDEFRARSATHVSRLDVTRGVLDRTLDREVSACDDRLAAMANRVNVIGAALESHDDVNDILADAALRARAGDGEEVLALLDGAVERSLGYVTPASEELFQLNALATQQIEALRGLGASLEGDADIALPARALFEDVASFVSSARTLLEQQSQSVALALAAETRRAGSGETCRRMVMEARLLTLAVRVEAGRLGDMGAEIVPIADQLGAFTAELHRVVVNAAASTSELRGLLVQIRAEGKHVADAIEVFAVVAPRAQAVLVQAMERISVGVHRALTVSRERAGSLLEASHGLIASLQFQDRFTQEARALQDAIRAPESDAPARTFLDMERADGLSAGDMMLF